MDARSARPPSPTVSRRQAVRQFALLGAGAAAWACTPLRVVLRAYPDAFDEEPALTHGVLRAFVLTVIPGAPPDDPNLVRAYYDDDYPLARYRGFLAADLCARAERLFGRDRFDRLGPEQRTAVVQDGLGADAVTRRLYRGAVFLAQIAVYAGIYDDARGAPLSRFEGRYRFPGIAATTHPNPERFLARAITPDGNPA